MEDDEFQALERAEVLDVSMSAKTIRCHNFAVRVLMCLFV